MTGIYKKSVFVLGASAAIPFRALAHVKWFCSYDVTKPPVPPGAVLDLNFLMIFSAFSALVFIAFFFDGIVARRFPKMASADVAAIGDGEKLMRVGMGAFFLCTWDQFDANHAGVILTPELHTQAMWVSVAQFAVASFLVWRRTCVLSGIGICLLYGYGITQYGLFHMVDYVYFLGVAIYFVLTSFPETQVAQWRRPLLTGCLAFSLIWTAVEKLLYPQWSRQLMVEHGHMMMGLPFPVFIVIAAFVEFTLAFYLATGRGLIRFSSLALLLVFVTAMPEFGPKDVVGHFPLVAILATPVFTGISALQAKFHRPQWSIAANAARMVAVYVGAVCLFMAMYYGVQRAEYGAGAATASPRTVQAGH